MIDTLIKNRLRLALRMLLCLLWVGTFVNLNFGQTPGPSEKDLVSVKTWKRGTRNLPARTMEVQLSSAFQYEWDLSTADKHATFRLRLRALSHSTIKDPNVHCWSAELREITGDNQSGANLLGPNLLSPEGPGVGDNFPREDWAAFFCPVENPNKVLDGLLYPIRATRRFSIEGFVLELRVIDYRLDNDGKLEMVRLRIAVL